MATNLPYKSWAQAQFFFSPQKKTTRGTSPPGCLKNMLFYHPPKPVGMA